jgi:hypothetical protein
MENVDNADMDMFRDVPVDDYSEEYSPNSDETFKGREVTSETPVITFDRTNVDEIQKQIIFVDPASREMLKSMNPISSDFKHVNVLSRNTTVSFSDETNLVVARSTIDITLPKISVETQRSVGENKRLANTVRITSVIPTVSHVLKASNGDKFITGSTSKRVRGGETKNLYGINGIWYET